MDSLITAAARALAVGDPISALNHVALRNDASALALRGIAMAQLGDYAKARNLLRAAAKGFGHKQAVARARCLVAETEIALVSRDLNGTAKHLSDALATLDTHGDRVNAAHARNLEARRLLLIGQLDAAKDTLAQIDTTKLPPASLAAYELVLAGIALRRVQTTPARAALSRAGEIAMQARIPSLQAEVYNAMQTLTTPIARAITRGEERLLLLEDVEALLTSKTFIVDACRLVVRDPRHQISLTRRPVLFRLVRLLCEGWPNDVTRDVLIKKGFQTKYYDETHRGRLRVEMGRLRKALQAFAEISATSNGFVLTPLHTQKAAVLAQAIEDQHSSVLALLADGELWSSSALALALDISQRSVQRALDSLAENGKVQPVGAGRARRWMTTPVPGFTTGLLLPTLLTNS